MSEIKLQNVRLDEWGVIAEYDGKTYSVWVDDHPLRSDGKICLTRDGVTRPFVCDADSVKRINDLELELEVE